MSNEVETKIKTFVAAEKVATESWVKVNKWRIVGGAVALVTVVILIKVFWP